MIRIKILILALVASSISKADSNGPAYQYDKYSENGKYYFKSIPFHNYDLTNFGKTIVYDNTTQKEIYKFDNYLPSESFITNNGKSLVTLTDWMWGHSDFEDQILIKIYIAGTDSIQFYIDDLVSNKSRLQKTSSHTLWYNKVFVTHDTLFVLTLDKKVIRIDLNSGKIIDKRKIGYQKTYKRLSKNPEPKTTFHKEVQYPDGYVFPNLISGKPFRQSLIKELKKTEVATYLECEYYIMIYGTIDQNGNCEIFMIQTSINEKEDKVWETQVKNWITTQKYKTDLIPKNCDKWVFQEYFYLK